MTIPARGVVFAFGLLLGLGLSSRVARRLALDPDRIWNLGMVTVVTFYCGAHLLVIACNVEDFFAHPGWMLGLTAIRDQRYLYAAFALAICVGAGYISAWGLAWRSTLDALAPGAGITLGASHLGLFAGARTGDPRGTSMLIASVFHFALAGVALSLILRTPRSGNASAVWLFFAGLISFSFEQLSLIAPDALPPVAAFSPAQLASIAAMVAGTFLWFSKPAPVIERPRSF